jgi:UDP-N-acetylglucosamine 1-carboxyvinyltransferase
VLNGTVHISGAKNAALAAMCASLLSSSGTLVLHNIPDILDTYTLGKLLEALGVSLGGPNGGELRLNGSEASAVEAPTDLITSNRASFQVVGPLLGRFGRAVSAAPGGDVIGQRPLDVHLAGFEAMGARISRDGERYVVEARDGLRGARIFMDYASVTGTQNVMMAATLAHGTTTIINAATEPEVQQLGQLLNAMGARVRGHGTQIITIDGVEALHGADFEVMGDRIEAGTFAIAATMTNGEVTLAGAPGAVMDATFAKLEAAGACIEVREDSVTVRGAPRLRPVNFQALPYPGLATDLHAPMAAMLTQAGGVSVVHERVFDNRMLYVNELRKLGAEIVSAGSAAIVSGPTPLHGTRVDARDVRAGAALVLAGLVAEGRTVIEDIYHLDRGYERLDEKLRALGASIRRE